MNRKPLPLRLRQILPLMAAGLSNQEIADRMGLQIDTIRTHNKRLFVELGAKNRAHAVAIAFRDGLLRHRDWDGA